MPADGPAALGAAGTRMDDRFAAREAGYADIQKAAEEETKSERSGFTPENESHIRKYTAR